MWKWVEIVWSKCHLIQIQCLWSLLWHEWLNQFDFETIDRNGDYEIDFSEMERNTSLWNHIQRIWFRWGWREDDKDAFPNDPLKPSTQMETVLEIMQTWLLQSVMTYLACWCWVFILLIGAVVIIARGGGDKKIGHKKQSFDEQMLGLNQQKLHFL